jgi:hypothetical protein
MLPMSARFAAIIFLIQMGVTADLLTEPGQISMFQAISIYIEK